MNVKSTTLSIVIPAFNEQSRLPKTLESLKSQAGDFARDRGLQIIEIWVVDDGSTDGTGDCVQKMAAGWPELRILTLKVNQGKGAAVREGFLQAHGKWILLADADMSTPWSEIEKLFSKAQIENADLVIGSRALPQSEIRIRQSWLREHLGKTFNFILRLLTGVHFRDTQCGFKLVRNTAQSQKIFRDLVIRRFAFDVELVLKMLAENLRVCEVAVVWEHKEESRVHPIKDGFEMLFSVLGLRLRLWRDMMLRPK